ncbi:MAG TPA: helix-turn-helix transcriptional regulator [Candidatus Lustribacter sp.]|nr:helix-turn-helix transcriptional regulator [Candidatus Lustribacter sp.]
MRSHRAGAAKTAREILREARFREAVSQGELAARAGVPQSVVAAYECGAKVPTIGALQRLVGALGFELSCQLRRTTHGSSTLTGPIGQHLLHARDDVLAVLAELRLTNPRVVGDVARGEEGRLSALMFVVDDPGAPRTLRRLLAG